MAFLKPNSYCLIYATIEILRELFSKILKLFPLAKESTLISVVDDSTKVALIILSY